MDGKLTTKEGNDTESTMHKERARFNNTWRKGISQAITKNGCRLRQEKAKYESSAQENAASTTQNHRSRIGFLVCNFTHICITVSLHIKLHKIENLTGLLKMFCNVRKTKLPKRVMIRNLPCRNGRGRFRNT